MTSNQTDLLFIAIKAAFDNWTAYQLALTHNFAGSKTKEIADWFLEATHQYIRENDDLEDYELEEFFEDTMNTEFNSILEDDSAIQLARLLLNYNKMIKQNKSNEVREDLAKRFTKKSSSTVTSSIKYKDANLAEDDSSSSETDGASDDDDEDDNMEADANNNDLTDKKNRKNQLTEKEEQDYQMVEEGWTFVAKSGKHLTK